MIGNVVLPGTGADGWLGLRAKIHERITASMGGPEVEAQAAKFEELRRWEAHGLEHMHIRYHVIDGHFNEAIIVLPDGGVRPAPAVLTIHGTNGQVGKLGVLDPDGTPNRAFGIELARRGYVTLSPDQFGFGNWLADRDQPQVIDEFFARRPNWSLDGIRTLEQSRAIDVLETLDDVDSSPGVGVIGNSLGGRAALHLAALDERISAAVPSCGLSPVCSNIYRLLREGRQLCPKLNESLQANGKPLWEYNELLALCAPRAVLLLEPFNDPYNPDIAPVFDCFNAARAVYELLDEPGKLAIYAHGDGHDVVPSVREMAYNWIERFLK